MDTNPKETAPKGRNWLTIVGIVVLAILIIIVIWAVMIWNSAKNNQIVEDIIDLEPQINAMLEMTLDQIENQAEHMTAADLAADPTGLKDRYLVIEGALSKEESMGVEQNIAMNIFSENENYNGYVLDDAIVVIDITGEGPQGYEGDMLKAWGKLFVLNIADVWTLPIVGPNLKTEFANVEGMSDKVIFLIAKGVKIEASAMDEEEPVVEDGEAVEGEAVEGEAVEGEAVEGEAVEGEPVAEEGAPETEDEGEAGEGETPAEVPADPETE